MNLCLALNYGGRTEVADAARRLAEDAVAGRVDLAAAAGRRAGEGRSASGSTSRTCRRSTSWSGPRASSA